MDPNLIAAHIDYILSYQNNIEKLTRPQLGEEFSFLSYTKTFNNIFTLLTPLKEFDFSMVPTENRKKITAALESIKEDFLKIENFNLKVENPRTHHISSVNQIENHYTDLFRSTTPLFALKLTVYPDANKVLNEMENLFMDAKEISANVTKLNQNINKIHEDAQRAAGQIGVAKYSEMFENQYKMHESSADWWLIAMIGILVSIIGTGIFFWTNDEVEGHNTAGVIHFAFIRLLFLTVLFYALNMCSKNYKSHKHNSIVNKHRANALNTFQTFVDAAKDDNDTKNAVLLEAARTIFSGHQTAYLNNENESESPIKIIEMIKSGKI